MKQLVFVIVNSSASERKNIRRLCVDDHRGHSKCEFAHAGMPRQYFLLVKGHRNRFPPKRQFDSSKTVRDFQGVFSNEKRLEYKRRRRKL